MNEIQTLIQKLEKTGWTLAAVADRLGIKDWDTIKNWKLGVKYPNLDGAVIMAMNVLLTEKPPMKRRYKYNEEQASN